MEFLLSFIPHNSKIKGSKATSFTCKLSKNGNQFLLFLK